MNQISITISATDSAELAKNLIETGNAILRGMAAANQIAQAVPAAPMAPTPTIPTPPTQAPAPAAPAPTAAPTYTLDDLSRASAPLMDAGKQAELVNLLSQFGVQALTQLPKERYGEFATALRGLGAKI